MKPISKLLVVVCTLALAVGVAFPGLQILQQNSQRLPESIEYCRGDRDCDADSYCIKGICQNQNLVKNGNFTENNDCEEILNLKTGEYFKDPNCEEPSLPTTCSSKTECSNGQVCCAGSSSGTYSSTFQKLFNTSASSGSCVSQDQCGCQEFFDDEGNIIYPETCDGSDEDTRCCICQYMKKEQCDYVNEKNLDQLLPAPDGIKIDGEAKTKKVACEKARLLGSIIQDCRWSPQAGSKDPENQGECISRFEDECDKQKEEWNQSGICDATHISNETSEDLGDWIETNSCDATLYERFGHGRGPEGVSCPMNACIECSTEDGSECDIIWREYGCATFQEWNEVEELIEEIQARLTELGGGRVALTADRASTTLTCRLTPVTVIITKDGTEFDYGDCDKIMSESCVGYGEKATCEKKDGSLQDLLCCSKSMESEIFPTKYWFPVDNANAQCPFKDTECGSCDFRDQSYEICRDKHKEQCDWLGGSFEYDVDFNTSIVDYCCTFDSEDSPYACPIGFRNILFKKDIQGSGSGAPPACINNANVEFTEAQEEFRLECVAANGRSLTTGYFHHPGLNECRKGDGIFYGHWYHHYRSADAICCGQQEEEPVETFPEEITPIERVPDKTVSVRK